MIYRPFYHTSLANASTSDRPKSAPPRQHIIKRSNVMAKCAGTTSYSLGSRLPKMSTVRGSYLLMLILFYLMVIPSALHAQKQKRSMHEIWEQGLPYITNFTSQEYKASLQNWCVSQDNNGIIYVGNSSGLLEYDGSRWRLIKTPRQAPVKSMARDKSGRIYVGGVSEVGYIESDPQSGATFHSLLNELDSASRKFNDVWFTYAIGDNIFFVTDTHILRWSNNKFKVWRAPAFGFSWLVRDQLYVHVEGKSLLRIVGDQLVAVKEASQLFKEKVVTMLLPHGDHGFMAITNKNECYAFDNAGVTRMVQKIPTGFAYNAVKLQDGNHLLATLNGGIYFLDKDGVITKHITKRDGLNTDTIIGAFVDAEGDVWLAGDNGIMRLEVNSPLRVFDEHLGVDEDIDAVMNFNNEFYITTIAGLFQLKSDQRDPSRRIFSKVEGIDFQTFHLGNVGDQMMISNFYGLYTIDNRQKVKRLATGNFQITTSPTSDSSYLLVATADSKIGELSRNGESWKFGNHKIKLEGRPYRISQLDNGNIFISTRYNGLYELRWTDPLGAHTLSDNYSLIHYDTLCGLPSMTLGPLTVIDGDIFVPTMNNGLYKYNRATDSFKMDSSVMESFADKNIMSGTIESAGGKDFWMPTYKDYQTSIYKYENSVLHQVSALGRISNLVVETIYDTHEGIIFLGSDRGLLAFDHRQQLENRLKFPPLIRKVSVNKDSTLFTGYLNASVVAEVSIPYEDNNLSFEFALPSYDLSSRNEYQYFLEGFDAKWSEWTTTSNIDFTNLFEGDYVFRIRAKNVYGQVSEEAFFGFTVQPPLHRTWWAYTLYGIVALVLVALIVQWRSASLHREKIALEVLIAERTERITEQSEKLKEMDRTKSRFYANISHEFRTPLTLILAPLDEEIRKRNVNDNDPLRLVKRNAERLLELVNQLLDLSKLDAGKMTLQVKQRDLVSFLNIITGSFESWASNKEIIFEKVIGLTENLQWYDQDKLEKMITNLLANAFKFTHHHGVVSLDITTRLGGQSTILVVSVSNTGDDIPMEEQAQIFSPFYQTKQTIDGQESGTGLGLSLVKELVTLHKGTITLISNAGVGTTFLLELPISRDAFNDQEIEVGDELQDVVSHANFVPDGDVSNMEQADEEFGLKEKDSLVVVEDNADLRGFISSILQPQFTVYAAKNGEEAVELALEKMPSLVLSDLMMPRLDGMQLTERIKGDERTSHIPVILLTAKNESRSRIEGLRIGADDYLTKPFVAEELLVRISNLIDQRKRLSVLFRERILVEPTKHVEQSLDDKFVYKVKEVIESRMGDASLSVEKVADEVSMSRTQLFRKLKALTGLSPNEFIKDLRLKKAADLIRQKADTITQIGYAVGFNDQSYFTKCFKKQYGVTPTEFSQG